MSTRDPIIPERLQYLPNLHVATPLYFHAKRARSSCPFPHRCHQVSWKGELPPLSAHDREFPSEEGSFNRLDEPLTVTGSICRADWVEGESGRCRTLTETGEKREDGWVPKGCVLCNTFEASPCRDLFVRCVRPLVAPPVRHWPGCFVARFGQ